VAIKILEQVAGDFNPRTALEPLLHHRLSHPNIVQMYDISMQASHGGWVWGSGWGGGGGCVSHPTSCRCTTYQRRRVGVFCFALVDAWSFGIATRGGDWMRPAPARCKLASAQPAALPAPGAPAHVLPPFPRPTHPQEVDVCEDGRPLQEVWMVLEYCSRGTLTDAISRGALCLPGSGGAAGGPRQGAPDVPRVIKVAREVASAMAYLHGQVGLAGWVGGGRGGGAKACSLLSRHRCCASSHAVSPAPPPRRPPRQNVLHGDLNGNNILLVPPAPPPGGPPPEPGGVVAKVADFGLSRLLPMDSDRIVTRTHGTITHMAVRGRGGGRARACGGLPDGAGTRCCLPPAAPLRSAAPGGWAKS
jgi:serine/threonine protein kinase